MTNTWLDLMGQLDSTRERIFRDVTEAASTLGISFFVVGACARDLIMELYYGLPVQRATNDIDVGLQLKSWEEFARLKEILINKKEYRADLRQPQRLHSTTGVILDLVPFGEVEKTETRSIAWPPEHQIEMNAFGFTEAYEHSLRVQLAVDLEVRVSSLAGLTLMKLVAWQQRRQVKDAKDLKLVLTRYLQAGNLERLYSEANEELLNDDQFITLELTGIRLLGRDVASLLTAQNQHRVLEILMDSTALAANMAAGAYEIEETFMAAQRMLEVFAQGVTEIK
jgi:predicted nucleotidyltransferase